MSREGRINVADRRYQVGAHFAGETVEVALRGDLLEVRHRGVLVSSHVRREVGRAARPPAPACPPRPETDGRPVLRKFASSGEVSFAGTGYRVGSVHRGEQVEVRLVGSTVQISQHGTLLRSHPARHDRFREHGAFSTPSGRPTRSNASRFSKEQDVTQVPELMLSTGGGT